MTGEALLLRYLKIRQRHQAQLAAKREHVKRVIAATQLVERIKQLRGGRKAA